MPAKSESNRPPPVSGCCRHSSMSKASCSPSPSHGQPRRESLGRSHGCTRAHAIYSSEPRHREHEHATRRAIGRGRARPHADRLHVAARVQRHRQAAASATTRWLPRSHRPRCAAPQRGLRAAKPSRAADGPPAWRHRMCVDVRGLRKTDLCNSISTEAACKMAAGTPRRVAVHGARRPRVAAGTSLPVLHSRGAPCASPARSPAAVDRGASSRRSPPPRPPQGAPFVVGHHAIASQPRRPVNNRSRVHYKLGRRTASLIRAATSNRPTARARRRARSACASENEVGGLVVLGAWRARTVRQQCSGAGRGGRGGVCGGEGSAAADARRRVRRKDGAVEPRGAGHPPPPRARRPRREHVEQEVVDAWIFEARAAERPRAPRARGSKPCSKPMWPPRFDRDRRGPCWPRARPSRCCRSMRAGGARASRAELDPRAGARRAARSRRVLRARVRARLRGRARGAAASSPRRAARRGSAVRA